MLYKCNKLLKMMVCFQAKQLLSQKKIVGLDLIFSTGNWLDYWMDRCCLLLWCLFHVIDRLLERRDFGPALTPVYTSSEKRCHGEEGNNFFD